MIVIYTWKKTKTKSRNENPWKKNSEYDSYIDMLQECDFLKGLWRNSKAMDVNFFKLTFKKDKDHMFRSWVIIRIYKLASDTILRRAHKCPVNTHHIILKRGLVELQGL